MAEVRLEKVTKNFGKGKGVFNISMQVEDGEFFVLLGPSGCGKTTTLRIIAGLELLDSGKIYLGRNEITDFPPKGVIIMERQQSIEVCARKIC